MVSIFVRPEHCRPRPRWACPSGAKDWSLQRGVPPVAFRCRRPARGPGGGSGREKRCEKGGLLVVNPALRWGKPSGGEPAENWEP